jgi:AraC family transcriptional regulator
MKLAKHNPAEVVRSPNDRPVEVAYEPRGKAGLRGRQEETSMHHHRCITMALARIHAEPLAEHSLEELARLVHVAPFHFHCIFRRLVGTPIQQYIRSVRLERAAFLLLFTDMSVIQIALEAGYESHEAFTRIFKKTFKCPPIKFRQAHLPCDEASAAPQPSFEYRCVPGEPPEENSLSSLRLAYFGYFGEYEERMSVWEQVSRWVDARGLGRAAVQPVGVLHDHPDLVAGRRVRYDAGIIVDWPLAPEERLGFQWMPARHCLVSRHRGPVESVPHAYLRLAYRWAVRTRQPRYRSLPVFEFYEQIPSVRPLSEVDVRIGITLR